MLPSDRKNDDSWLRHFSFQLCTRVLLVVGRLHNLGATEKHQTVLRIKSNHTAASTLRRCSRNHNPNLQSGPKSDTPVYRAMHFSAKRGLAIAGRLSVCPSVCNVGGLWAHRPRLEFFRNNVTVTVSYPGMFALCRPKHQGSTPRGTPGNFGPKWPTPCWFERWRHSIAITNSATVTMESL